MVGDIQQFDVCVVCALPEETRAFLEVVEQQCKVTFEQSISSRYHSNYRFTTIKNGIGEPLNLHVSWLSHYGPLEMTLHLSRVLDEYQPRIAIMTGICAGDIQRVQLGDLVVAERTFTYDNGKFTLDEHGRSIHEHNATTYQLNANILQFLRLFDDWETLIVDLDRPPSPPEIRLQQHEVRCHISAMASGNAVRADNPFEDVQAPVRDAVAIDMEGAAFGLVMSRHSQTHWLIVKGVCDYADRTKNDVYHSYAARASALYALSFIQAYVTEQRMPGNSGKGSIEAKTTLALQPQASPSKEVQNIQPSRTQTAIQELPLAASLSQALSWVTLPSIQRLRPHQHRRLVGGIMVALVALFLSTIPGIWSSHYNPTTKLKQQPPLIRTVIGTPRPGHPIGVITEYPIPTPNAQPDSITLGPDGNLWFTEDHTAKIGRITRQGQITEFLQMASGSNPSSIIVGPDHNIWILENGSDKIARVTPQGQITEFPLPPGCNPIGVAFGKDGNLWFTEFQTNKIGRMNISGKITGEFPIPTPNSGAAAITQGPDGNLWFTENPGNMIGKITTGL